MKKHISLIFLLVIVFNINAQAPQGFNYQGTVRNSNGDLVMNEDVSFKFNILQGSQTASPSFVETHLAPTDDLGQVTLVIGQGSATTGDFSEIDWSLGDYYLDVEIDTGNGYIAMGVTSILSVPYALYSENSKWSTVFDRRPRCSEYVGCKVKATYYRSQNSKTDSTVCNVHSKAKQRSFRK